MKLLRLPLTFLMISYLNGVETAKNNCRTSCPASCVMSDSTGFPANSESYHSITKGHNYHLCLCHLFLQSAQRTDTSLGHYHFVCVIFFFSQLSCYLCHHFLCLVFLLFLAWSSIFKHPCFWCGVHNPTTTATQQ